jgi:hypothetical protein
MLLSILAVAVALCIVGLSVWVRCRLPAIPPNAQLLLDAWASVEGDKPPPTRESRADFLSGTAMKNC